MKIMQQKGSPSILEGNFPRKPVPQPRCYNGHRVFFEVLQCGALTSQLTTFPRRWGPHHVENSMEDKKGWGQNRTKILLPIVFDYSILILGTHQNELHYRKLALVTLLKDLELVDWSGGLLGARCSFFFGTCTYQITEVFGALSRLSPFFTGKKNSTGVFAG